MVMNVLLAILLLMEDGSKCRILFIKDLVQKSQNNISLLSEKEKKYINAFREVGICIDNAEKDELQLYPSDITIEITTQCNLACKHCSYSFGGKKYREMPIDMIKAISKWSEDNKVKRILLTGGEHLPERYSRCM